ncbi:MAG: DUF2946 domain-containing protein [Ideonella sp.]|nr:DUF2946 domain-containing protein [Ideonella sp.]
MLYPRRRLPLWLALVALCFAALAPTVSHALASAGHTTWVEVCTAQGMRLVAVADSGSGSDAERPASPAAHLEHCPYCTLGTHGMAPPPASVGVPAPTAAREGPPERFWQAPHTAHAWCSAQPRAPPRSA